MRRLTDEPLRVLGLSKNRAAALTSESDFYYKAEESSKLIFMSLMHTFMYLPALSTSRYRFVSGVFCYTANLYMLLGIMNFK